MPSHPYYVSVVELKNNRAEKIVELTCRLFTDDMETALKHEGSGPIDLTHPSDKSDIDKKLFTYLKKHLAVSINNQKPGFEYVGYEIREEAVNIYIQIAFDGKFQTIRLSSDLLYREHPEQTGIYHFIDGEKKESRRLINPQKDLDIKF
jgi:hypothetical protein